MTDKRQYEPVNADDSDDDQGFRRLTTRRQNWASLVGSFLMGLFAMGIAMAVFSASMRPSSTRARVLPAAVDGADPVTGLPLSWSNGDCGNSPKDAKARKCKYNMIINAWLPGSCMTEEDDQDAAEMYKDGSRWVFEADTGKNLTVEELASGNFEFFTTQYDFHVTHCMYAWKRLHRALLDPSRELDSVVTDIHHTGHCASMIAGHAAGEHDHGTKVFVKYPTCAK